MQRTGVRRHEERGAADDLGERVQRRRRQRDGAPARGGDDRRGQLVLAGSVRDQHAASVGGQPVRQRPEAVRRPALERAEAARAGMQHDEGPRVEFVSGQQRVHRGAGRVVHREARRDVGQGLADERGGQGQPALDAVARLGRRLRLPLGEEGVALACLGAAEAEAQARAAHAGHRAGLQVALQVQRDVVGALAHAGHVTAADAPQVGRVRDPAGGGVQGLAREDQGLREVGPALDEGGGLVLDGPVDARLREAGPQGRQNRQRVQDVS